MLKVDPISLESVSEVEKNGNTSKNTCIIRRNTIIYTSRKKMKSNKKPRQIPGRKAVKGVTDNDADSPTLSKVVSTQIQRKKSKIIQCRSDSKPKLIKKASLLGVKKLSNVEETTIVKQGSKRLKVISPKLQKMRAESRNCSNIDGAIAKPKPKVIALFNKQKNKGTFGKLRSKGLRVEQTKLQKSSRVKSKSQSLLSVKVHGSNNEDINN